MELIIGIIEFIRRNNRLSGYGRIFYTVPNRRRWSKITVKEFLEQTLELRRTEYKHYRLLRSRVTCKDGFSVVIMVDYEPVELWYANRLDSLISDYAENPGRLRTKYHCVPVDLVERLLEKHGGIDHWRYFESLYY